MFKNKFFAITISALLIFVSGCNLSAAPAVATATNPAPSAPLETQVAQAVAATYAAQTAISNSAAATLAAVVSNTPEFTFTPSLTPTLTFTLTPNAPMVSVSVNTNCRSGPGSPYDILGVLNVGQNAEVVGRSSVADYWIIKLPSNPAVTCTIWGQYATLVGNTSGLPVVNPPPTPTPAVTNTPTASFTVSYYAIEVCGAADWGIKFQITNNGSITWESNRVIATDSVTAESNSETRDFFPNYNESGCALTSSDLNLEPGEVGFTSTNDFFTASPSGHSITATIRVCSLDGLAGTCLDKTITFTP